MAPAERWPRRKNPHILLCAALGRGHTTPMLALAQSLASTGQISVTVLFQNEGARASIDAQIFRGMDVLLGVLDPDDRSEDPPWLTTATMSARIGSSRPGVDDPFASSTLPLDYPSQSAALERVLGEIMASDSPPIAIVNDFSLPWVAAPAKSVDLPRYVLYTDPASFMALAFYWQILVERGALPARDPCQKIVVPGIPPLLPQDIGRFVWDSTQLFFAMNDLWHKKTLESDGVLLNTFEELESTAVDALRGTILAGNALADSLFPVGPLIVRDSGTEGPGAAFGSADEHRKACIGWLDAKPESSVVYVCFGSWEILRDEQIPELARGLEASGVSFLWIAGKLKPSKLQSLLPDGFSRRAIDSGRGLIVADWVPQQEILQHRSIGGFVSQCGWNSVIECVCLAGVPILCWPFAGDQPTTARVLVDGIGIAVEIHDEDGFVRESEVERALRELMGGTESERIRSRARALKALAVEAWSSKNNVKVFVDKVLAR